MFGRSPLLNFKNKKMEQIQEIINARQSEILAMKAFLNATDYIVLKLAEGYQVDDNIIQQRKDARDMINQLEIEIREHIQALAQRYNSEVDLLEKLPEDVRPLVEEKLSEQPSGISE